MKYTTDTWPRLPHPLPHHGPRDCTDWVPYNKARDLERKFLSVTSVLTEEVRLLRDDLSREINNLTAAQDLLRRCRDSAGRMELGLYEEIQEWLQQHQ